MWVIDRKNLKVIEVPDSYRECSICFEWKPESDFRNEGEDHVSRSNCHDCFMLSFDDFMKANKEAEIYKESLQKDCKLKLWMRALETELRIRKNGVSKEKVKEYFDKILNAIPDDAIVDMMGGDVEAEQVFSNSKKFFRLNFSEYEEGNGFWG